MKYAKLSQEKQERLLIKVKEKLNVSWRKFVPFLGKTRRMLYLYKDGKCHLPLELYIKLCSMADEIPENVETIEIFNTPRKVKIPKHSELLAEFLGILAGDGYLGSLTYQTIITLDKNSDREYGTHIQKLFKELFCTESTLSFQKNVARHNLYSKEIYEFLNQKCEICTGNKMNKLHIPSFIWKDEIYLTAFLRGVFDTDGSFHKHHKNDAAVEFTSADKEFLNETKKALLLLNFNSCLSGKSIYIYKKFDIKRFFEEIRPSNVKHVKKYEFYCKNGYVPTRTEALAL